MSKGAPLNLKIWQFLWSWHGLWYHLHHFLPREQNISKFLYFGTPYKDFFNQNSKPFPLKIGSLCLQKWVGYLFLYNVWLSNWSLKQFLATKCNKFVVLAIIKSIFFKCKGKWMWRRCCYEFLISIWGKNDHIHH